MRFSYVAFAALVLCLAPPSWLDWKSTPQPKYTIYQAIWIILDREARR